MTARRCWHCGGAAFHRDIDGEYFCRVCGRQALPPMSMADAARLGGVSLRTVKRWADAGLVAASPPAGAGAPEWWTARPCSSWWTGAPTSMGTVSGAPANSRRQGAKVSRRWCADYRARQDVAEQGATKLAVTAEVPAARRSPANSGRPEASRISTATLS